MNILIAGTGWLGLPLAHLLRTEISPYVSGTTTSPGKAARLSAAGLQTFVYQSGAQNELPDFLFDIVILNIPPADKSHYTESMLELGGLLNSGGQLLFISSTGVYLPAAGKLSEESPTDPGHVLTQAETALRRQYGDRLTIIRFGGLIGAERHPVHALARRNTLKNGNSFVNLIHLEDCLGVILHVLQNRITGVTINACAPEHPSRKDYYKKAAVHFGLEPPVFTDDHETGRYIDSSYLVETLGYAFRRSICDWTDF